MEIIATALSIQKNLLLPTINLHTPDPNCDLDYIPNVARTKSVDIALSNHFAFGGANAALVLKRYIE
jgi:3-oxoacyl-[acyl-carrier-protein] synthase II